MRPARRELGTVTVSRDVRSIPRAGIVRQLHRSVRRTRRSDVYRLGLVLALLAGTVAAVRGAGLRIQHTPSLPMGLYRTVAGAPVRGAIGLWCLPVATATAGRTLGYLAAGSCAGGTEPLGKIVLGVAGDTIRYGPAGVVLNGRVIPNTRPLTRDSRGRLLAHVPFGTYVLRTGEVWVFSPFSSASWDSRYFGPIPTSALSSLVTPVWTTRSSLAFERPLPLPFAGQHERGADRTPR